MCGIVGYIGAGEATEFLIEGLRRLEYRGYDSAGIGTVMANGTLGVVKTPGRIDTLVQALAKTPLDGSTGIGHTRWATHGPANQANAHPHLDDSRTVAVVHNGVIENFRQLKDRLEARGHEFASATDSEVIAHLINHHLQEATAIEGASREGDDPAHRVCCPCVIDPLGCLRGTYGLVVLFRDHPDLIMAARLGSPSGDRHWPGGALRGQRHFPVGRLRGEDRLSGRSSSRRGDGQGPAGHASRPRTDSALFRAAVIDATPCGLNGYPHYMIKEIFEQPESLQNTMRGRLSDDDATAVFGGLNLSPQQLRSVQPLLITACGTSWHAALVGEYLIEELVPLAGGSGICQRTAVSQSSDRHGTLLFAITQSGETADTLAALREMKRKGHPTLAICNVVGSTIAQEADGGIYLHAGPEIGVASTKAYTSQCLVMTLLALYFGRLHHLGYAAGPRDHRSICAGCPTRSAKS